MFRNLDTYLPICIQLANLEWWLYFIKDQKEIETKSIFVGQAEICFVVVKYTVVKYIYYEVRCPRFAF